MSDMSSLPLHTTAKRRTHRPGVEYEFERLTIPRDFSRNFVTKLLVERAEHGGWELDRVRIAHDGTRRVVLKRKNSRQRRPVLA